MADSYDSPFHLLLDEIRVISPESAQKLEQIASEFGTKVGYYAAFVIACLEARIQQADFTSVLHATVSELKDFTYFEYVGGQPYALELFAELLASYQECCKQRYEQRSAPPASV